MIPLQEKAYLKVKTLLNLIIFKATLITSQIIPSYNFFSPDTIDDENQPYPIIEENNISKDQQNGDEYLFAEGDVGVYHLAKVGYLSERWGILRYFVIDDVCIEDYWKRLGVKACQYSAGVIKLFLESDDIDNDGDGYTENQGDCNDGNISVYPDASELCDGII